MTTHEFDYRNFQFEDAVNYGLACVDVQLARVDTKASILFGLALAALTGGAAIVVQARLSGPALAVAVLVAFEICVALLLLGAAIRPDLRGNFGFVRWASARSVDDLRQDMFDTAPNRDCTEQLWLRARSVQRKYRRVRLAVDILGLALATTVVAAPVAVLNGAS